MIFTSIAFIIFFVVVMSGTLIIQLFMTERTKYYFLLIASYFFYGWWNWRFCFLLLFVTVISYITALHCKNRLAYITGIIIPLAVLGVFKYFGFFLDTITALTGRTFTALHIILPVGISFYTFQALSYVIDVKRSKISPEYDFIRLALYISFFPQLVAGPIVRASDFMPQLHEARSITAKNFCAGIQIMAFGFFKKIVMADHLSVFVDQVFRLPAAFHWATIILAIISYSMQIYFDFSGYSDIAIGCAKCLGYDFVQNFNLPYLSQSITEFWRRWHISLSSWLRDYVYIPLGGNRNRQYMNLMITMLLGGLWHGANWTFVFWGGINGLALCAEKKFLRPRYNSGYSVMKTCLTFSFISFTWIFFRSASFSQAWRILRAIFTLQAGIRHPFSWSFIALVLMILCEICAFLRAKRLGMTQVQGFCPVLNLNTIAGLTAYFVFVGLILTLAFMGENPFVYFQF